MGKNIAKLLRNMTADPFHASKMPASKQSQREFAVKASLGWQPRKRCNSSEPSSEWMAIDKHSTALDGEKRLKQRKISAISKPPSSWISNPGTARQGRKSKHRVAKPKPVLRSGGTNGRAE